MIQVRTVRLLFYCFCFCPILVFAQASPLVVLSGTVSKSGGLPVGDATVQLAHTTYAAISDMQGHYRLEVKPGNYTMIVTMVGFDSYQVSLTVKSGVDNNYDVLLKSALTDLDEVLVVGKTQSQELKESGFTVNAIETRPYQNTTADINQLLDRSTGVRIRQSGGMGSDYSFSINGLSGNAVKYFIDGIPIEAMGSIVNLNNIPVNLAKSVEVYKGVVPVAFGADAMGGIVNVVTNQNLHNYLELSHSYGSFSTQRSTLAAQFTDPATNIILRANSFFNYSKNNYLMRGVEVYSPEDGKYVPRDLRRFHDDYFSVMGQLEGGVVNRKWADLFFLGGSYSRQDNEIQSGSTQNILYGGAERAGQANHVSLRYKKNGLLFKGLNVGIYGSLVRDKFEVVDTTYRKYAWDQSSEPALYAEMSGQKKSLYHYRRPKEIMVGNFNYELNDRHSFNLNYTFTGFTNTASNDYDAKAPTKDRIAKQITGIAYQQNLLDKRLTNVFSFKQYRQHISAALDYNYRVFLTGLTEDASKTTSNYGWGIASRYKLSENTGVKLSFEHAYRLQSPDEMLGDGVTLIPNFRLRPENSNNANAGLYGNFNWGNRQRHRVFAEAGWFYRKAKDFINTVVYEELGISQYQNVSNVTIDGFEAEVRYSYDNLLGMNMNASYQHAVNTTRGDGATPEITYLNRIPNRPWIFGNAGFYIGKDNVLKKGTRLQFNWDIQYIHWFYLTWEAFGSAVSKATIPSQFVQNASVSYSLSQGKYNFSIESRNFTNALAYDNFRLQKPGTAWFVKARIFLTNTSNQQQNEK